MRVSVIVVVEVGGGGGAGRGGGGVREGNAETLTAGTLRSGNTTAHDGVRVHKKYRPRRRRVAPKGEGGGGEDKAEAEGENGRGGCEREGEERGRRGGGEVFPLFSLFFPSRRWGPKGDDGKRGGTERRTGG